MARRGPPSKIDRLPQSARESLIQWLSEPGWTRQDATDALHALLDELGMPADHPDRPAVDSVNRFAQTYAEQLAKMRERQEVATAWLGQFGRLPEGQLGQMLVQVVHGIAFDSGLALARQGGEADPEQLPGTIRMVKDLSLAIERLEMASTRNQERETQIRAEAAAQAKAEAADTAAAAGTRSGLSAATVEQLRREILGVA